MRLRKYLEEQTISGDVAGYDTPASTKMFKRNIDNDNKDYVTSVKIKSMDDVEKIYRIADEYNLDVERPRKNLEVGNTITLSGTKENIKIAKNKLKRV